jgi:hypothetical protein
MTSMEIALIVLAFISQTILGFYAGEGIRARRAKTRRQRKIRKIRIIMHENSGVAQLTLDRPEIQSTARLKFVPFADTR